eukprot:CAMPEP_0202467960 /NCGR_PEP_ID=MMETSP1360-20130828/73762_1 /ASSEMBLY_ACC=CAM_ASM_000848 /TAXON_ID=515479 /ORGANISM="Licmophora paradoxa, Strain CCMP2313" /LENGTH=78 /DNA_ID=CAMNT_0049092689 /DNA_START=114 /DNA_END=347 /DNA_ORIENTATION=+
MASYKDEVALIVKCDHLASFQFRVVRKERAQESSYAMTKTCAKAMKIQFRNMGCRDTVLGYILRSDEVADFEKSGRTR